MPAVQKTTSGRSARKSAMANPFCPSSPKTAGSKPSFPAKAKQLAKQSAKQPAKSPAKQPAKSPSKQPAKSPKPDASKSKAAAAKSKTPVPQKKTVVSKAAPKSPVGKSPAKSKQVAAKKVLKKAASPKKVASPLPARSARRKATPAPSPKKKVEPPKKKAAEAPKKKPQPPKKVETPKRKAPETPKRKAPESPKKEAPKRKAPETPKKVETPKRKAASTPPKALPIKRSRPESPRARADSPRARPESPRVRANSPRTRPESPRTRAESPRTRADSPRTRPGKTAIAKKTVTQPEKAKPSREERMKQRKEVETPTRSARKQEIDKKREASKSPRGSERKKQAVEEEAPKKRAASQSPRGGSRKKQASDSEEQNGKDEKGFDMKIKMKTPAGKKGHAVKGKESEPEEEANAATETYPVLPPLEEAPRKIICLDCGEPFFDRKSLTTHKRTDCKSIFPESAGSTETSQKVVMCGQCGLHCPNKEAFVKHSETCQKQSAKDEKLRKCNYCFPAVWFPGFPLFLIHMREAHNLKQGNNLFMCNKCSSLFMTKLDLQTHKGVKCVENAAPNTIAKDSICCKKCKATFNTPQQLKNHTQQCKGGSSSSGIVCNYCNTTDHFSNEKELHAHKVKSHQGNGLLLFNCSFCGKRFDHDEERQKHQATHQGNNRVEVPMAEIMKKIGELPKPSQRDRGFGSNADAASPFITELSASNGNHAFAIKIDTSSGKPKVTVGMNEQDEEPSAPRGTIATPVIQKMKSSVTKGMQSTSSPPKLSISTGKCTPVNNLSAASRNSKVGYVVGSLNLVSAKPVGPQVGSITAKHAAGEKDNAEVSKALEKLTQEIVAQGGAVVNQNSKPNEKKEEPSTSASEKPKQAVKGKPPVTVMVNNKPATSAPSSQQVVVSSSSVVIQDPSKISRATKTIVVKKLPAPASSAATHVFKKEVPVITKMLQAKTPSGKPIMVPIAITQGIHVEPVGENVVQCSECRLKMSSMQEIANHACARCMKCTTIMHSLVAVADHVCSGVAPQPTTAAATNAGVKKVAL